MFLWKIKRELWKTPDDKDNRAEGECDRKDTQVALKSVDYFDFLN